jgi:hypothetical protein
VGVPDRDPRDVVSSFEASARAFGCKTEGLGRSFGTAGRGEARVFYGYAADCEEQSIALIAVEGGHVRIGCRKPTTRAQCDGLLRQISEAR